MGTDGPPLAGLPQLPPGLESMSRQDLMQFLVGHQANWVRTANQLVTRGGASDQVESLRNKKRQATRKARYWRNKFQHVKKDSETKIQQLVQQTDPYVRSKRRKTTAFRFRFTTFGGYRLALARNIGHCSASATLTMLDADSTHRQTLVRWERLLAASVLFDQRGFNERGVKEAKLVCFKF